MEQGKVQSSPPPTPLDMLLALMTQELQRVSGELSDVQQRLSEVEAMLDGTAGEADDLPTHYLDGSPVRR